MEKIEKKKYFKSAVDLAMKKALEPDKNFEKIEKRTWARIAFILASELKKEREKQGVRHGEEN